MAKNIKFNGDLDYNANTDNYSLRMTKNRPFPWWWLLLLLPLLLLIKCNREISVSCYEENSRQPLADQDVYLEYTPHFIYNDGEFFPDKKLLQVKTTDAQGYVLFDSLPCSVFSYIFYGAQRVKAYSTGLCNTTVNDSSKFHFTKHIDLFLKCPQGYPPANDSIHNPPNRDTIPTPPNRDTTVDPIVDDTTHVIPIDSLRGESGNLRINLQWSSRSDFDLLVVIPCGDTIYFNKHILHCNGSIGILDVDANREDPLISDPQENIYFETPAQGVYQVFVLCWKWRNNGESTQYFNVSIIDNNGRKNYPGSFSKNDSNRKFIPITQHIVN